VVEDILDSTPDIASGVTACFAGAAATLRERNYAYVGPVATVALEVANSNEPLRRVTADILDSWLQAATIRFERAGMRSARARQLAAVFVAALEGGFLLSRATRDTAPMEAIGHVAERHRAGRAIWRAMNERLASMSSLQTAGCTRLARPSSRISSGPFERRRQFRHRDQLPVRPHSLDTVLGGPIVYPATHDGLMAYAEATATAPDELTTITFDFQHQ
jgi:hypothetical protein